MERSQAFHHYKTLAKVIQYMYIDALFVVLIRNYTVFQDVHV